MEQKYRVERIKVVIPNDMGADVTWFWLASCSDRIDGKIIPVFTQNQEHVALYAPGNEEYAGDDAKQIEKCLPFATVTVEAGTRVVVKQSFFGGSPANTEGDK